MKTGQQYTPTVDRAKVGGFVKKKLDPRRGTIMQWSDEARQLAATPPPTTGKRGMKKACVVIKGV